MMKEIIYLDNSATTKPDPIVIEEMKYWLSEGFGNPSAKYDLGYESRKAIENARIKIATYMGVGDDPDSIIFTSSGSEANNLAIKGMTGLGYTYNVTSVIEHPSVLKTASDFVKIGVTPEGIIDKDNFPFTKRIDFISTMMLNNITGMKQPMDWSKDLPNHAIWHVDAVQSFGKMPLKIYERGIDMLSASGHKIGMCKGIGLLYVNKRARKHLKALIDGEQERGYRGGTESVPFIMGFSKAIELAYENMEENKIWLQKVHDYFVEKLIASNLDYEFNCPVDKQFPTHLNVSFNGIKGEQLQSQLNNYGIYISTGSACSSNDDKPNSTLKAMGYSDERCNSSIRFSFSKDTELADIDYTMEVLEAILPLMK